MKKTFAVLTLTAMGFAACGDMTTSPVPAPGGGPNLASGSINYNATCSQLLGGTAYEIKIDPIRNDGTYTQGPVEYTISSGGKLVSFTSTVPLKGVFVKGGTGGGGYFYDYRLPDPPGGRASDSNLGVAGYNEGQQQISHISFCWDQEPTVVQNAILSGTKTRANTTPPVGLAGWMIFIFTWDPALNSGAGGVAGDPVHVTTDAAGAWSYATPYYAPGTTLHYAVCEEQRAGWAQVSPASGDANTTGVAGYGTCRLVSVAVGAAVTVRGLDFANTPVLSVSKTANASLTRNWTWQITKTGDQNTVDPYVPGTLLVVNYGVTVTGSKTESNFRVSGLITIANPTSVAVSITSVTDDLGGSFGAAAVTGCTVGTAPVGVPTAVAPYSLAANTTLVCSYSKTDANLAGSSGSNSAYVTSSDANINPSPATAGWNFANATLDAEIDECIMVTDDRGTPLDTSDDLNLGQVCASQLNASNQYTFASYSLDMASFVPTGSPCTSYQVRNIASFASNDTRLTGSDDHTVTLVCRGGETATGAGYQWSATNGAPSTWFMYTPWSATNISPWGRIGISTSAPLIAGQHHVAGTITGTRTSAANSTSITIALNTGWGFADALEQVKIHPMSSCSAKQAYVSPGQFSRKVTPTAAERAAGRITVSGLANTACYGIHVDVVKP